MIVYVYMHTYVHMHYIYMFQYKRIFGHLNFFYQNVMINFVLLQNMV